MGAVFFVAFMLILLAVGAVPFAAGLTCLGVWLAKRIRWARSVFTDCPRAKAPRSLLIIAVVLLVIGGLIIAFPIGYFGLIAAASLMPPPDYVETDITVTELAYPYETFVADGVTYRDLALGVSNHHVDENGEVCFSYDPGFFDSLGYENFFSVPNEGGFDLVYGLNRYYAPEDECDAAEAFYDDPDNTVWYFADGATDLGKRFSEAAESELDAFFAVGVYSGETVDIDVFEPRRMDVDAYSRDLAVHREWVSFILYDGVLYVEHGSGPSEVEGCRRLTVAPLEGCERAAAELLPYMNETK